MPEPAVQAVAHPPNERAQRIEAVQERFPDLRHDARKALDFVRTGALGAAVFMALGVGSVMFWDRPVVGYILIGFALLGSIGFFHASKQYRRFSDSADDVYHLLSIVEQRRQEGFDLAAAQEGVGPEMEKALERAEAAVAGLREYSDAADPTKTLKKLREGVIPRRPE